MDKDNFWVRLYDDPNDLVRVHQVSNGAWTQKNSAGFTITTGSTFTMTAEVRAGAAHDYAGTVPGRRADAICAVHSSSGNPAAYSPSAFVGVPHSGQDPVTIPRRL